jgi:hypothetical protein
MYLKFKICDELPGLMAGIVFIALILGLGYIFSHHQNSIEKRYGFCTMTPDIIWIPCHIEPLMIRCVEKGGAFDEAGFNDRDIIVLPQLHAVDGFHKLLKRPKGTIIEIMVIPYEKFEPDCETDIQGEPEKRVVVAP